MLVDDVMQRRVVTITPHTTLPEAMRLARERGIRHLPVVEDGRLVGIVSDRDLKQAMASPATSLAVSELRYLLDRLEIGEIMTRSVITVPPMLPVEEAARLMIREKVSALPVTDGAVLVGIVTETDVVDLLVRALGAGEPSTRLDIELGQDRSALADAVRVIEATGATVASVVTLTGRRGVKEAIVRVATIDPRRALEALRAHGLTVREAGVLAAR
jgi:acetoin utilization protein AcuB